MKDLANEETRRYSAENAIKVNFDLAVIRDDLKMRSSNLKAVRPPPKGISRERLRP